MASPGDPAVLRVSGLSKSFGDVRAVDGLSFEVRRGEIFGFLGPNGAGKTTAIKLMCGLLRPDGGTVEVRGSIGLSPQQIAIWESLTPDEQLRFAGRIQGLDGRRAARRADELVEALGLGEKRSRLARTLSGGMQRRLNIALALVHEPEILFLDEPQAGLDPQSRVLVREYVRGLREKATVVLTTHDMEEAEKLSDRVCIIDHGRVLVRETVSNIKSAAGTGDVVEIETGEGDPGEAFDILLDLGTDRDAVNVSGRLLTTVSPEARGLLSEFLKIAQDRGLRLDNARVRAITLEDVFLKLTGRGLRE